MKRLLLPIRSTIVVALTVSLSMLRIASAAEPPPPGWKGPESTSHVLRRDSTGAVLMWRTQSSLGNDSYTSPVYEIKFPKPKIGDLIPDYSLIYRVERFTKNMAGSKGTDAVLNKVPGWFLPAEVRRTFRTMGIPLKARGVIENAPVLPENDDDRSEKSHLWVKEITRHSGEYLTSTTATIEFWINDQAADSHQEVTLHTGDELRVGQWTFKVTNIVPPQDLPKTDSFEGGHIVGWVEFALVEVKAEADEPEEAKSRDVK